MQEDYEPIQREEVKSRYNNCDLQENGISRSVAIVLTNARIVILNSKQNKANYGIPWIMIESYEVLFTSFR